MFLVGRPKGKRSVGRPRRREEDNIKMYFQDLEWDGVDSIDVDQDMGSWRALVNAVMTLGFYGIQRISRLSEELLASQEGL